MSFFSTSLSSWAADVLVVRHPWGAVATPFFVFLGVLHGEAEVEVFVNGEKMPGLRMRSSRRGLCRFIHWHNVTEEEEEASQQISAATLLSPASSHSELAKKREEDEIAGATLAPKMLAALPLLDGQNVLRYEVRAGKTRFTIQAFVYLWNNTDKVVICDIDGTITKSDNRGHILTSLGVEYEHDGVCELIGRLSDAHRIIYLTGRPASALEGTRSYISKLDQEGHRLPMGPMFTTRLGLLGAVISELSGEAASFKYSCLMNIRNLFRPRSQLMDCYQRAASPVKLKRSGNSTESTSNSSNVSDEGDENGKSGEGEKKRREEEEESENERINNGVRQLDFSRENSSSNSSDGFRNAGEGKERMGGASIDFDKFDAEIAAATSNGNSTHNNNNINHVNNNGGKTFPMPPTAHDVARRALFAGRPKSLDLEPEGEEGGDFVFVAAFGNSPHDKEAYEQVGIRRDRVFMIDKESKIKMSPPGRGKATVFESYTGMMPVLDDLFPKLKEPVPCRSEGCTPRT